MIAAFRQGVQRDRMVRRKLAITSTAISCSHRATFAASHGVRIGRTWSVCIARM
jgi:hypothetical protein